MKYSKEILKQIWKRTQGKCHICWKRVNLRDYGTDWNVEHSKPRYFGGSDHLNNLFAAHISCNRSKSISSTRSARAKYGYTRAPYSKEKIEELESENSLLGGLGGFAAAVLLRTTPVGVLFLIGVGVFLGKGFTPRS